METDFFFWFLFLFFFWPRSFQSWKHTLCAWGVKRFNYPEPTLGRFIIQHEKQAWNCAAACVCDDTHKWNILTSVQEVQLKPLLRSLVKRAQTTPARWPCVRCASRLQLELTSCVCLEVVNDPEQIRMTTPRSLCRHLGNNHRILRRGWLTSNWRVSSGISSLLHLLPRVRTTVSNSWSNHHANFPAPRTPTHPPTTTWSSHSHCGAASTGAAGCLRIEMFSSALQSSTAAELGASSQCAVRSLGHLHSSQRSTAEFSADEILLLTRGNLCFSQTL